MTLSSANKYIIIIIFSFTYVPFRMKRRTCCRPPRTRTNTCRCIPTGAHHSQSNSSRSSYTHNLLCITFRDLCTGTNPGCPGYRPGCCRIPGGRRWSWWTGCSCTACTKRLVIVHSRSTLHNSAYCTQLKFKMAAIFDLKMKKICHYSRRQYCKPSTR